MNAVIILLSFRLLAETTDNINDVNIIAPATYSNLPRGDVSITPFMIIVFQSSRATLSVKHH